jgi:superfamily I DNA/RNA helicase
MALSRFETVVQNQGYTYIKEDKHSTSDSAGRAIQSWEKWRKGARLDTKSIRNLNKFIPGLIGWVPRLPSTIEESPLDLAMKDRSWMDVIQIAAKKREYIRSCLANHESLFDKPRITISTIHHAKGGEADHVALITDITQNPWNQMETDSEKRVLYVALTRAKETLTLIQPATIRHYNV